MRSIGIRHRVGAGVKTGIMGLALLGFAGCSAGDSSTDQVTGGGSAALQGPMVFVNNTGERTLSSVALRGDSGSAEIGKVGPGVFGNVALSDMQFSQGEWLFVNLSAANQVATIDPLTAASPVHEANLTTGTRPVHIYRDPTDGEIIWSMNDGDNASGTPTPGDDLINCAGPTGGSVTILHNSHLGPGAQPPTVDRTVCVRARGHKVSAFSSGPGVPKRVFVSSTTAGEIAVIDNEPANTATYHTLIARIDLCDPLKESNPATCNVENPTGTTAFTPNNSNPHGIRFSILTGKVYSIQETYRTIVEIDPTTLATTRTLDLNATPYTAFGISPNGRFLLLRGQTATPQATKLGVYDLSVTPPVRTDFTIPELDGTSPGAFQFSPDGTRFYLLAGNAAAATKKDRLFAFDASTLTATPPALTLLPNGEIFLLATGGHSMDVLAQAPAGSPAGTPGAAIYIAVSNSTANSLSIINATDNQIKQTIGVGLTPGAVLMYYPGMAAAGNQATSSLTGGSPVMSPLPERLDDHSMPES